MMPSADDTELRTYLKGSWRSVDVRYEGMLETDAGSRAIRWKELQDREREERMYVLTKRAVYRGIMAAHFSIVAIAVALWIAYMAVNA
jgi:hypothetical protein